MTPLSPKASQSAATSIGDRQPSSSASIPKKGKWKQKSVSRFFKWIISIFKVSHKQRSARKTPDTSISKRKIRHAPQKNMTTRLRETRDSHRPQSTPKPDLNRHTTQRHSTSHSQRKNPTRPEGNRLSKPSGTNSSRKHDQSSVIQRTKQRPNPNPASVATQSTQRENKTRNITAQRNEHQHIRAEAHIYQPGKNEPAIVSLPLYADESELYKELESQLGNQWQGKKLALNGQPLSAEQFTILATSTSKPLKLTPLESPHMAHSILTPGFRNRGNQCFANAGLKQLILGLSLSDIPALKEHAYQQATSPAKTKVTLAFAELAEAVLMAREDNQAGQSINKLHDGFFRAVKAYGQSSESGSPIFSSLFPENESQPQQDPEEMLTTLSGLIGLDKIHPNLEQHQHFNSLDRKRRRHNSDAGSPFVQIPVESQKNLSQLFAPTKEILSGDNQVRWDDGSRLDSIRTDSVGHKNPRDIKQVKVHAKLFKMDMYGRATRMGKEARDLVRGLQPTLELPILNTTSMKQEKCPFQIQTIVVHIGSGNAQSGHYVTLEQQDGQDGQWILHNDSRVTRLRGSLEDYFKNNKDAAPYLISLKKV